MEERRFEVIGGKVVRVGAPMAGQMTRCTNCKIKDNQIADLRREAHDQRKKLDALKEQLLQVQNARAEKKEAYSAIEIERRHTRDCIQKFVTVLTRHLKFTRIVLWTLKALHDHPPGGFCVLCEQPDGEHAEHCVIGTLFKNPGQAILDHKDVKIIESDLPIPAELRVSAVEPMVENPWGMYQDLDKICRDGECGRPPLKGKLFCYQHMPKGY